MDKAIKQLIKKSTDWESLYLILKSLCIKDLSTREIELIHRQIQKTFIASDVKIAYLSNHTVDLLAPYTSVILAIHGSKSDSYIAPYGQYFQELLSTSTGLMEFQPDVIYLDLSITSLAPLISEKFLSLDDETKQSELDRIVSSIIQLAGLVIKNTDAYLLVANFVQPSYPQGGIADLTIEYGETEWFAKLNLRLLEGFKKNNRVFVLDKNNAIARAGKLNVIDDKMFYLAKMELNDIGLQSLADEIFRYIYAIKGRTKKNLVLDLDNTLWGGVVGEDGVDGVKVGKGCPEGEIFYAFQVYIKSLKLRGIILSVASKNNPEDAEEVFVKKNMPLKLDDFAMKKINWNPKHDNLSSMAKSLNIGIDSFVFLDDNPVERGLIKTTLPEVAVPELTKDPCGYLTILKSSPYFEKLFMTEDDISKAQQYKENAQREEIKEEIGDMNTFLNTLGTQVNIGVAKKENIQRIHQLFSKTNQFNVTTKRYKVSDIEEFIDKEQFDLFAITVKDNFGEMGMVGLVLVKLNTNSAQIDSFILSCRAMGRFIETAIMNAIKNKYLLSNRIEKFVAEYIPTAKNVPVKSFFDSQGFDLIDQGDSPNKNYELMSKNAHLLDCPGIEIEIGEY